MAWSRILATPPKIIKKVREEYWGKKDEKRKEDLRRFIKQED